MYNPRDLNQKYNKNVDHYVDSSILIYVYICKWRKGGGGRGSLRKSGSVPGRL